MIYARSVARRTSTTRSCSYSRALKNCHVAAQDTGCGAYSIPNDCIVPDVDLDPCLALEFVDQFIAAAMPLCVNE
jgi:hypothetical protein